MQRDDTIAAIATAPGRGAIAIVRASGPGVPGLARAVFPTPRPLVPRRATRGRIVDAAGTAIDDGLALLFRGPASATGEDVLELHVHGSPAVARETLLALLAAGARLATPGEFTRRAFLAGKLDLTAAEAVADVIAAEHRSQALAAAARLSGGIAAIVDAQTATLERILERLAASLDFPDEVDPPARDDLARIVGGVAAALAELGATWEAGRLVREGVTIAIVGPPNAGKSSLLNGLLGADRALVSPIPGTTRDTIEERLSLAGGVVARIIDTAGLRHGAGPLEAAGIARSERALTEAAIAVVVVDGAAPLSREARALLARTRGRERVVYFNKADLGRAGYDARSTHERDALLGSTRDEAALAGVRAALGRLAPGDRIDLARPHLGTARQADAVLEARRALAIAQETLRAGAPLDLIAGDLAEARAALRELTGRDASETLLDAIFARFCIGK